MKIITATAILALISALGHANPVKRDVTDNQQPCQDPSTCIKAVSEAYRNQLYPFTNVFAILSFQKLLPVGSQPSVLPLQCTTHIKDPSNAPFQERSTCPYYYVYQTEADRIPRTITQVRCSCNNCIGDNGSFHPLNTCQEITHPVPVLKKNSEEFSIDGLENYRLEMIDVPVACACLRPRERFVNEHIREIQGKQSIPDGLIG
ncbi:uncharacterized protein [Ptychodera flava]|uniref:uncharacterized protein n=1 Tax=Ptychodera flava TaxID=63121 RepID=UPI003969D9D1